MTLVSGDTRHSSYKIIYNGSILICVLYNNKTAYENVHNMLKLLFYQENLDQLSFLIKLDTILTIFSTNDISNEKSKTLPLVVKMADCL